MLLYNTKYLQLKSTKSKEGNEWIYAHRPNINGVVVILPIIASKDVLFLIEERPPLIAEGITTKSVALPAGLVGDERIGETLEEAIYAELREETGLIADRIEIKTKHAASSPGCITEITTIAFAYISEYKPITAPISDGGVIVDRILVSTDNINRWLKEKEDCGYAITTSTLAALYYLIEEQNK